MTNKNKNEYPYNLITDVVDGDCLLPFDVEGSLEYVLTTLPERERNAVIMYYKDKMTCAAIAKINNVTTERARQIISRALHKLRHQTRIQYITKGVSGIIEEQKTKFLRDELSEIKALIADCDAIPTTDARRKRSTPLEHLDLSVRSYNCLYRAGIRTLGAIADLSPEKLADIRNIGRRSYCEIVDTLAKCGYPTDDHKLFLSGGHA